MSEPLDNPVFFGTYGTQKNILPCTVMNQERKPMNAPTFVCNGIKLFTKRFGHH